MAFLSRLLSSLTIIFLGGVRQPGGIAAICNTMLLDRCAVCPAVHFCAAVGALHFTNRCSRFHYANGPVKLSMYSAPVVAMMIRFFPIDSHEHGNDSTFVRATVHQASERLRRLAGVHCLQGSCLRPCFGSGESHCEAIGDRFHFASKQISCASCLKQHVVLGASWQQRTLLLRPLMLLPARQCCHECQYSA